MPSGVYIRTIEARQNIRVARLGTTLPEEVKKKIGDAQRGVNSPSYKGYYHRGDGRVMISLPDGTRRRRAHLVMEQMIGRPLVEGEVVHHKNGIEDDDRPENLQLFAATSEHSKLHSGNGDLHQGKLWKIGHPYYPPKSPVGLAQRNLAISAAKMGHTVSPETREKIRQGLKRRHK